LNTCAHRMQQQRTAAHGTGLQSTSSILVLSVTLQEGNSCLSLHSSNSCSGVWGAPQCAAVHTPHMPLSLRPSPSLPCCWCSVTAHSNSPSRPRTSKAHGTAPRGLDADLPAAAVSCHAPVQALGLDEVKAVLNASRLKLDKVHAACIVQLQQRHRQNVSHLVGPAGPRGGGASLKPQQAANLPSIWYWWSLRVREVGCCHQCPWSPFALHPGLEPLPPYATVVFR
jgi:hypothetical protein